MKKYLGSFLLALLVFLMGFAFGYFLIAIKYITIFEDGSFVGCLPFFLCSL